MAQPRRRPALVAVATAMVLGAGLLTPGPIAAAPGGPAAPVAPGGPVAGGTRLDTTRDPVEAARAYARRFARDLPRDSGLQLLSVRPAASGHTLVRLQQTVHGVPVLAGQLVVALDSANAPVSLGGEVSRHATPGAYALPASAASERARRAVAAAHGLRDERVRATRPTRMVLDPGLIGPGGGPVAPVWRVETSVPGRLDLRDLVLVDARSGAVRLRLDQTPEALDRVVCDHRGLSTTDEVCRPGHYTRVEGQAATGIADVDQAYDMTGTTAQWFLDHLGVDLTDLIGSDRGDGRKLRSTTRYCGPEGCPLENAFWSGDQLVFGAGFTSADDVVAHELAHGVSQVTAGLIYWFQAGAISESLSDVFGELVDQADGIGADTPELRWKLGEDLPAAAGGIARDMANPTAYDQPDSTGSDLYDFAPDYDDSGAVHTNSGVSNKAAYLIADGTAAEPGGAFNGHAFPGLGPEKTALLYWTTLQLLTPGTDFADLGAALQQACANLAATGTGAFVATDCASVAGAVAATGMSRWAGPNSPREVTMDGGIGSVQLRWERPGSSLSAVSSYAIWVRPMVGNEDFVAVEPGARSHLIEQLPPGVAYTVGISAVNAEGASVPVTGQFMAALVDVNWPEPPAVGGTVQVNGVLRGAGTQVFAGRQVRLLRRYPAETAYRVVDTDETNAAGRFWLQARPVRGARYVVEYAGRGQVLGDQTPARDIPLRQRVSLRTDPSLRAGQPARFTGIVSPARPGAPVMLQRLRADGQWRTTTRSTLDSASSYSLTVPGGNRAGVWRVRVPRIPGGALAAGLSRRVTITVAAP